METRSLLFLLLNLNTAKGVGYKRPISYVHHLPLIGISEWMNPRGLGRWALKFAPPHLIHLIPRWSNKFLNCPLNNRYNCTNKNIITPIGNKNRISKKGFIGWFQTYSVKHPHERIQSKNKETWLTPMRLGCQFGFPQKPPKFPCHNFRVYQKQGNFRTLKGHRTA